MSIDPGPQEARGAIERTDDAVDDLIARWHAGEGMEMPLHDWLGMTEAEYKAWAEAPGFATTRGDNPSAP